MGDKGTRGGRKTGDLNGVFLQFDDVSTGGVTQPTAGEIKVVSTKGAVPKRVGSADALNYSRQRARGLRREGEEEEVGLLWVPRDEVGGAVEGGAEEREWRSEGDDVLLRAWWVDEDLEVSEHLLVVGEEGGGGEVRGGLYGGVYLWQRREEEEEEEEREERDGWRSGHGFGGHARESMKMVMKE